MSPSGADPRLVAIEQIADALRALLTRLEDPESPPEALRAAHARYEAATGKYQELVAVSGEPDAELVPELREALDEVLRLNAVATSVAQRQKERAVAGLAGGRRLRKGLTATGPPRTGGSCDVAG